MRLIDADKLIEIIKKDINKCYSIGFGTVGPLSRFIDQINDQPTAYNTDKVVEQLEELLRNSKEKYYKYLDDSNQSCIYNATDIAEKRFKTIEEVIDIVKGGGISE